MAQIIFTMPDEVAVKVTEAFCGLYGYQEMTEDADGNAVANPQTPAQFAQQQVVAYVRKVVTEYTQHVRVEQVKLQTVEEIASIEVSVEAK
jgi:hypothetical protein